MSFPEDEFAAGILNDRIGTEMVLEAGDMRVWHLRLAPGERILAHRHDRPYFWTVLTDGRGRSRFGDGRDVAVTYRAGETRCFPNLTPETGFIHDLVNTGDNELVFVTAEFGNIVPTEDKHALNALTPAHPEGPRGCGSHGCPRPDPNVNTPEPHLLGPSLDKSG